MSTKAPTRCQLINAMMDEANAHGDPLDLKVFESQYGGFLMQFATEEKITPAQRVAALKAGFEAIGEPLRSIDLYPAAKFDIYPMTDEPLETHMRVSEELFERLPKVEGHTHFLLDNYISGTMGKTMAKFRHAVQAELRAQLATSEQETKQPTGNIFAEKAADKPQPIKIEPGCVTAGKYKLRYSAALGPDMDGSSVVSVQAAIGDISVPDGAITKVIKDAFAAEGLDEPSLEVGGRGAILMQKTDFDTLVRQLEKTTFDVAPKR